jgi:hypothetical protein
MSSEAQQVTTMTHDELIERHPLARDLLTALAGEKQLFCYAFEGGAYVRLVIGGDVDTGEALDILGKVIEVKRAELLKARSRSSGREG